MIRIATIVSIFLLVFSLDLNAQEPDSLYGLYRPAFALKFVPLPIIHHTPAIQLAAEFRTFPHHAVQLEYGHIFDDFKTTNSTFNGYKFKTEYRIYNHKPKNITRNFFWGIQYHRKEVSAKSPATVWRDNQNYQEIIPLSIENKTNSFFIMFGRVHHISGSFFVENAFGTGLRVLDVSLDGLPEDGELASTLESNIFNPVRDEGQYSFFRFFYSLKLIYSFR